MNKLLRKLPFLIITCLLVSLLFSCGKDDAGGGALDLDPILVSGEIEAFQGTAEEVITHVVATDLSGTLLGSETITNSGTYQIARPDGFTDGTYDFISDNRAGRI